MTKKTAIASNTAMPTKNPNALPLDANLKRFVNHIKPLSTSGANAKALQDEQHTKASISLSHFV
jgi:hypothetical protein